MRTWIRQELASELEAALEKRASQDAKAVRELVGEMEDVLEKFHRVVAREAKRRARAMKSALEDSESHAEATTAAQGTLPLPEDVQARKMAIRRRVGMSLTRRTGES